MLARDLMTTSLVTVPPDARLGTVAQLLAGCGISSVPVVDAEGRLLGIVTEADLVRQLAIEPAGRAHSHFSAMLTARARAEAERFARLHGSRARDVMTTEIAAVAEDTPLERIAELMEQKRLKRVPVLREGKLLGLVSRADLLRLAFTPPAPTPAGEVSDEQLRRAVEAAMGEQPWADVNLVYPTVESGVVTFHGYCRSPSVPKALRVLAERVPGVKQVELKLEPPPALMLGVP